MEEKVLRFILLILVLQNGIGSQRQECIFLSETRKVQHFIQYTRDLRFDDKPDYEKLKMITRTTCEREKIKYDLVFDWNIKNSEKEKKEQNVTK